MVERTTRRSLRLSLVLLALLVVGCFARKDRNRPHAHRGVIKPYSPGPFDIKLTKAEEAKLAKGDSVMKQTMPTGDEEEGGSAICVQDINAPKAAVWFQILDLDNYRSKISKLKECKNYYVKQKDGTYNIKTKQVLGVLPGYSYESYYDHTYDPQKSSMTWSLDYDKTSDFDDVAGHWHVADHPNKPGCTRVFYACDIKMKGSVPGPILNYISKAALKQATSWVKKESEAHPDLTIPSHYGGSTEPHKQPELVNAGGSSPRRSFWGLKQ